MEDMVEESLGGPDTSLDDDEAVAIAEQEVEEFATEEEYEESVETASAIAAAAEAEFLETEAILNAPPNADYLPEEDFEEASKEDAALKKEGKKEEAGAGHSPGESSYLRSITGKKKDKKEMDAGSETLLVAKGVMEIAEEVEAELEEKSLREADELNALDMDLPSLNDEEPNGSNPNEAADIDQVIN
jgi:hypothetical protein